MRLTANDIYTYFKPSECPARICLRQAGVPERPPCPYEEALKRLGLEHEKRHLATLGAFVDLSSRSIEEAAGMTAEAIDRSSQVIYQSALQVRTSLNGTECEIVGRPDFLICRGNRDYVIRDSKISRRITMKDHPEILLQLELYGWLFEKAQGRKPDSLEVQSGTGDIVKLDCNVEMSAIATLQKILMLKQASVMPYTPVGWSKCSGCGFYEHCWPSAESRRDVALVQGVDQGLATALHEMGVNSYDDLLKRFTEVTLAEFKRPYGNTLRKVGKAAASILKNGQALSSGREIIIQPPAIPLSPNYVMFDLEGLPPQLDETEKIYLWGMQVFGAKLGSFQAAVAGFGPDGDRDGWNDFLQKAGAIIRKYGDVPFVHWHHYERTHVDMYIERYGDRDGIAARVKQNLVDLLPVFKESVVLPLPSNSLKIVEKYIGFKRQLADYRGDTAIAKFIEATEMSDENQRAKVMEEILQYNQEDLAAMWAVFQWLKSKM